jgi:hypothetical protein
MEKKIILEIKRMKEIMGILVETQSLYRLSNIVDDGVKVIEKSADEVAKFIEKNQLVKNAVVQRNPNKELQIGLDTITVGELQDLKNYIKLGNRQFQNLNGNLKRVLGILISNDTSSEAKKLTDDIYNDLVFNVQRMLGDEDNVMGETEFLKVLKNESKNQGISSEQLIRNLTLNQNRSNASDVDLLAPILGKKIEERIAELTNNPSKFRPITSDIIPPKIGDEIDKDFLTKVYQGKFGILDDLNNLPIYKQLRGGSKSVVDTYVGFIEKYIRNYYAYFFHSKKNMIDNAKDFIIDAMKKRQGDPNVDITPELEKATAMILLSKREATDLSMEATFNTLLKKNPNIGEADYKTLVSELKKRGIDIEEIVKGASEAATGSKKEAFMIYMRALRELAPFVKRGPDAKSWAKRFVSMMTWKDPRGVNEFLKSATKRGTKKEAQAKVMFFLTTAALTGVLGGLLDTWKSQAKTKEVKTILELLKFACTEANKPVNRIPEEERKKICDAANNFEEQNLEWATDKTFWEYVLKNLPIQLSLEQGWSPEIQDYFFWTYWDGLVMGLYKYIIQNPTLPLTGAPDYETYIKDYMKKIPGYNPGLDLEENAKAIIDEIRKMRGSTPEQPSTDTTRTTTPPQTSDLPPELSQLTSDIKFVKINENEYDITFLVDGYGLGKGKTTRLTKNGDYWTYIGDDDEEYSL